MAVHGLCEISDGLLAGFHLSFPCTMNVTAIATMHIVLHLQSSSGRRVNGSPLVFSLRKRCEASTPSIGSYIIFAARCYASAASVVMRCLSVRLCVCDVRTFCQNE